MYHYIVSFYWQMIFHCTDRPHFVHPFSLMDIWVSTPGPLQIMLLWVFAYKSLCGQMFSFLLEFLGHIGNLCLTFEEAATVFQSGCTVLYFQQRYIMIDTPVIYIPVSLHSFQLVCLFDCRGYEMVSHCGFNVTNDVEMCPQRFSVVTS